jgi:predicted nucleic acid-binding Zn ribbon protein
VLPVQNIAASVLAEIIRRQPASKERTAFAWSVAVGPALSRVTTVELRNARLVVTARDARWALEIERAKETILSRVQLLLGKDAVKGLYVNA